MRMRLWSSVERRRIALTEKRVMLGAMVVGEASVGAGGLEGGAGFLFELRFDIKAHPMLYLSVASQYAIE